MIGHSIGDITEELKQQLAASQKLRLAIESLIQSFLQESNLSGLKYIPSGLPDKEHLDALIESAQSLHFDSKTLQTIEGLYSELLKGLSKFDNSQEIPADIYEKSTEIANQFLKLSQEKLSLKSAGEDDLAKEKQEAMDNIKSDIEQPSQELNFVVFQKNITDNELLKIINRFDKNKDSFNLILNELKTIDPETIEHYVPSSVENVDADFNFATDSSEESEQDLVLATTQYSDNDDPFAGFSSDESETEIEEKKSIQEKSLQLKALVESYKEDPFENLSSSPDSEVESDLEQSYQASITPSQQAAQKKTELKRPLSDRKQEPEESKSIQQDKKKKKPPKNIT